ncbi:hypothetical protein ACEPIY_005007 [Escherichia coli]
MKFSNVIKIVVLVFFSLIVSGCTIMHNITLYVEGVDTYKSSVQLLLYKTDDTPYYNGPINYFIKVDRKKRYITYIYDVGAFIVGMPSFYKENINQDLKKLDMFIDWASQPYGMRVKTKDKVESQLPNNSIKAAKGITDFSLYMSKKINNNEPYLVYTRDVDYFNKVMFLINKRNAEKMKGELTLFLK